VPASHHMRLRSQLRRVAGSTNSAVTSSFQLPVFMHTHYCQVRAIKVSMFPMLSFSWLAGRKPAA
jgi:hypothetical protein